MLFLYRQITWTEFPEVIEVSIQMSIISSKYIQVSIVGNWTQKGKDSKELMILIARQWAGNNKVQLIQKNWLRLCKDVIECDTLTKADYKIEISRATVGTGVRVPPRAWERSFSFTLHMKVSSSSVVSRTMGAFGHSERWICTTTTTERRARPFRSAMPSVWRCSALFCSRWLGACRGIFIMLHCTSSTWCMQHSSLLYNMQE